MDTHVNQNSHTEIIALMVTHSAVTPESSGRGLSHATFFLLICTYFLCDDSCADKMSLAITQPPEVAGKCLKPQ